ncbi:MAG TPA: HK97 family phage prohead protease [Fermentimonas sp.]|nr:HK97 family phage prohead protease [Fermentimonas sp.]
MSKQGKSFVLIDESITTYGFRVLMSGADIKQFKRNPVLFYNHDEWSLPVGRWENIRIEGDKLLADPVFDLNDDQGKKIADKVENDFLRAASISFRIVETSDDPNLMKKGQTRATITKWMVREASIVGIGANHNALRLYDKDDKLIPESEIFKLFDKQPIQKKMEGLIFKLLDLPEGSTDEQVQEAIQKLIDAKKGAEADLKKLQDAEAERKKKDDEVRQNEAVKLVDEAVKEGRITADGKENFLKFFSTDYDAALKALTAIPKRTSVKERIEQSQQNLSGELAELNDKSWDELDKAGKLVTLKDKYPDIYKEKFKNKYGKEPEKV